MPSEAKKRANAKHLSKFDKIEFRRPKGDRAIISAHAAVKGTSLNQMLNKLIDADMETTATAQGMTLEQYRESLIAGG